MSYDSIPAELRQRRQWVVWRLEERDGKPTKAPYRADAPAIRASSTRPATWDTFKQALKGIENGRADGIGYVFAADDPYLGVDLDRGLRDADQWAIVGTLDSYTEFSVSGAGVHVILRASLNRHPRNRKGPFEVYEQGRYFCMTGAHVRGTPMTIEERQAELEKVLSVFLPVSTVPQDRRQGPVEPVDLVDRELIDRAMHARTSADFTRLWNGDSQAHPSRSEADLALCNMLSFWTGRDPDRVDRLFRASGLMREKWERADYRERTIQAAIAATTEVYQPSSRKTPELHQPSNAVDAVGASPGASAGYCATASTLGRSSSESAEHPSAANCGDDPDAVDAEDVDAVPFALPLDDFIAAKSDSPPALIGDETEIVLPTAGLVILFSRGGKGKTTFTVEGALHMASGVEWLGFPVPQALRILFIENEGPREPFRRKLELKRKVWPHEITGAIYIQTFNWGAFTLADELYVERLRAYIEEKQIDLVIGDPLDSLGIEGVGSPEDTRKFMELLGRAGLFRDVAFWLLHHPRKGDAVVDELDEASGAWGGKPDTMLKLSLLGDNRSRLSFPKLRWSRRGTRKALILGFDPDSESFTVVGEEPDEERDYLAEIKELLGDQKYRTAKEIAAPKPGGIGANESTVKALLEEHPTLFMSVNGAQVDRSPLATVWTLAREAEAEEDAA